MEQKSFEGRRRASSSRKRQPRRDNYIEATAWNLARKTRPRPLRDREASPDSLARDRLTKGEFTRFAPDDYRGWIIQNKLDERVFVRMSRAKSGLFDSAISGLLLKSLREKGPAQTFPVYTICIIIQLYITLYILYMHTRRYVEFVHLSETSTVNSQFSTE